jgi:hypothetical protein
MKYIAVFILIISFILSGCATTPDPYSTSTPKPTWTPFPHGFFNGCVYYDGEIVNGFFNIYDENENHVKDIGGGGKECTTTMLMPGIYEVRVSHYNNADCSEGCFIDGVFTFIEISDGETLDMDFEVKEHD